MQVQRKTLTQLSIPICFETLFYMLAGMVDTLMLSSGSYALRTVLCLDEHSAHCGNNNQIDNT
jgi:Na+-driven multidrug efflux pump